MGVERKCLFTLFTVAFLSLTFLFLFSFSIFTSPKPLPSFVHHGSHYPPAFAYFITGGNGDKNQIFRLLLAIYHPRNRYLLHLGMDASDEERQGLAAAVISVPVIRAFGNADVVGNADYVTHLGSSNVAITLRAAAIMMKLDSGWNWFVTLSARDYPLITQDDLSHVFSTVRRDLNFIEHTSDLGWKESDRFQPIVVDPGTYLARRSQIFQATQKRKTPDAFKLFTGSQWVILSRSFLEFCLFGWDNLPRKLLMYFTNVKLSQEGYFHSVICNAPEFKNTTVNGDLRYMIWDNPPQMEPHALNVSVYGQMVESGAAFARQFDADDLVLDMIDKKILQRGRNQVAPGAWCSGRRSWWVDPCSQWGDVNILKPGSQAKKLEESVSVLLDDWNSQTNQCQTSSE
ncbi:PREDICTED: beta-glucuronosyltransferase GlcAT14A-like [Lupinus angustifolius]|uniref:beta-glucuronosyltransferase GlcAT14A-like n=1 Tax=Lupinus angustifolius TaxID=3871 RepID=UPI00092F5B01|nr:PREDICTED: beta-glucuronosyltransferase GlcAT14A-like [Lupinus angustifolius]